MLNPIDGGIYGWESLEVRLKRHLNGWLFLTADGPVLVDPPQAPEPVVAAIEALGKPTVILLTGKRQERRARQFQGWYGAKVWAPDGDRKLLEVQADVWYGDAQALPGGFVAHRLAHQRSPGESVLLHRASRILVASHLIGEPAGFIQMQERLMYGNFSKAMAEQLKLLRLEFDRLLPGRGAPILSEARLRLAEHLASYRDQG